jgi:dynein heavy chain
MRDRHWADVSKSLGFEVAPDDDFTLAKVIELRLGDFLEMIQKVAESAAKEYQIEQVC